MFYHIIISHMALFCFWQTSFRSGCSDQLRLWRLFQANANIPQMSVAPQWWWILFHHLYMQQNWVIVCLLVESGWSRRYSTLVLILFFAIWYHLLYSFISTYKRLYFCISSILILLLAVHLLNNPTHCGLFVVHVSKWQPMATWRRETR